MTEYEDELLRKRLLRQQGPEDAQVAWLKRIFWLMLIVWVILPAVAGLFWALAPGNY